MADDKTIFWVIGLIIAGALLYHYGIVGDLFSIGNVCTWDEPITLEEYQQKWGGTISIENNRLFDIYFSNNNFAESSISKVDDCAKAILNESKNYSVETIYGKNIYSFEENNINYKVWCSKNNLFLISSRSLDEELTLQEMGGYFLNHYICKSVYTPSDEMKEITNYFKGNESLIREGDKAIYFTGETLTSDYFFMEFPTIDNFCTNWYLNIDADFLDGSNQDTWTIIEGSRNNKKYFYVNTGNYGESGYFWCHNPDLVGYASSKILMDEFFDNFYGQGEQKCYSHLAETCQEVPCSSNYVKFNTLLDCQNYYKSSCCGYGVINGTCVPLPECFTCSANPLNLTECNKQLIEGGTCESKGGFEIGTFCVTIPMLLIIVIIIVIGGFIILNKK